MDAAIKRRRFTFKKFIIILIAFNLIVIGGALTVFWYYLAEYEANLPDKLAASVLRLYQTDSLQKLAQTTVNLPAQLRTPAEFETYLNQNVNRSKLYYYQGNSRDKNEIDYIFASGDHKVSLLTLQKTGAKSRFGFDQYKIGHLTGYFHTLPTFTVYAPQSIVLQANGSSVTAEFQTGAKEYIKNFHEVSKKEPCFVTYQFSGWYVMPRLTAVSEDGIPCEVVMDLKNHSATVSWRPSDALQKQIEQTVKAATEKYSLFITNDCTFTDISGYLFANTEFYKRTQTYNNKWTQAHTNPTFSEVKISNLIEYASDLYSCDISYVYSVKETKTGKVHSYPSAYTCYLKLTGKSLRVVDLAVQ